MREIARSRDGRGLASGARSPGQKSRGARQRERAAAQRARETRWYAARWEDEMESWNEAATATSEGPRTGVRDGTPVAARHDTLVAVRDDTPVAVRNDTSVAARDDTPSAVVARAHVPREPEWRQRADALGDEIATLAAHMTAAEYQLLCKIREFDECDGWYVHGARSCAHWLNWRIGLGLVAAREKVRVARALGELPKLSAAMERGAVSYSKLRALTRIATPDTEEDLLESAMVTTASHVEKMVRLYRSASRPEDELERAARQQEEKHLRTWWDDDGMLVLEGRLPPEEGAIVEQALEAARRELFDRRRHASSDSAEAEAGDDSAEARAGDDSEGAPTGDDSAEARAADTSERPVTDDSAETPVARIPDRPATDDSAEAPAGDDSAETSQGVAPPRRTSSWPVQRAEALVHVAQAVLAGGGDGGRWGARAQVTVNVDAAVLADPGAPGRCEIENGASIAADTMRRLACDADVLAIVRGENGEPLGPGRRTRKVNDRLRRVLWERDRGCVFPGCTCERFLHSHHVEHWGDGGPTHTGNLICLCTYHHLLVHEGGFSIVEDEDGRHFLDPRGRRVDRAAPLPEAGDPMPAWRREHDRSIDRWTTMPDWDGEAPDYEEMLRALFWRDRKLAS